MSTAYSDPTSTVTNTWSTPGSGYASINSGTRQPTAGNTASNVLDNSASKTFEVGMADPGITGTVTQVVLWAYCRDQNGPWTITTKIKIGGSYTATQNITPNTSSYTWFSLTFGSLSLDAASCFSGATTRFLSDAGLGGGSDNVRVTDAYWEITYSPPSGSGMIHFIQRRMHGGIAGLR